MQGNPYSSNEPGLGPLMRDIKNKICQDVSIGCKRLIMKRLNFISFPVSVNLLLFSRTIPEWSCLFATKS